MTNWLTKIKNTLVPSRENEGVIEQEKIERLETAEREVKDLQERGDRAVQFLVDRQGRNHFAESIRMSMKGGTA